MSELKINSGGSLRQFIDSVISETVSGVKSSLRHKALQEKEKQMSGSSQDDDENAGGDEGGDIDLFGNDDSGDDEGSDEGGDEGSSKTMDDETEMLEQGDIEAKDVVEKLNSIRSGKSFKDDQVKTAMEQYVESLSTAEKTALLAFLKGIAQIVTGEMPGNDAIEPDSNPANIDMQKDASSQKHTKHIQPNVIKASPPKQKQAGGAEDTSGPTPITPKKR